MTWAEFILRSHAYFRAEEADWRKVRRISYTSLVAPYQDHKKIAKTEEKWMPLPGDKKQNNGVSEKMREAFLKATEDYINKRNG